MSNVLIDRQKIDILANAISDKSGVPVTMTLDEMVEAVDSIELEPALQAKTYTVNSAGTSTITADSGYDGLSSVSVSVPEGGLMNAIGGDEVNPTIDVDSSGLVAAYQQEYVPVTPIYRSGWLDSSAKAFVFVYGSSEYQLPTQSATAITPTESSQTAVAKGKWTTGAVTVNAIPSNYVGSGIPGRDAADLTISGDFVGVPYGYYADGCSARVASGTAGTPTATKGTVSNHSVSVTPSVTNTTGYITGSTKTGTAVSVSASELVSGTYTVDSSGTKDVTNYASASVPSGTEGTPTATKGAVSNHSVSVTPSVTNTAGYITGGTKTGTAVTVSASELVSGTYTVDSAGTKDVTNYASASVPSLTLPGSTSPSYTGTRKLVVFPTRGERSYINIPTGFNDTAAYYQLNPMSLGTITITENGTYNAADPYEFDGFSSVIVNVGSGGTTQISEADATSTTASISFTGLPSEPTSFYICYVGQSYITIPTGTPYKTVDVVYDGTNTFGNIATSTNNAQASYSTNFSYTYSNGTLTVTGTASNFIGAYHIIYTYGGSTADIHTEEVQVGSGATSITFTGLEAEPAYWSCAFKSNFGTNTQNYQRVMSIGYGYNGNLIIGYAVGTDISVGAQWTWTYNNGSLTITSQGTNAGGYFHQPGYYQLTYAYDDGGGGNYQSKTVTPTTSQQVIEADSGYDALSKVTVTAVSQTNLTAANIKSGTTITISNGQNNLWSVTGTYSGGGGSANIATATMTNSNNQNTSIAFTLPSGRTPKAFFARLTSQIARNSSSRYYYVFDMRWDGSSTGGVAGNTFYMYSGTLTDVTSGYSYSQSGTTFTLSSTGTRSASPGSFYNGTYELVYIY